MKPSRRSGFTAIEALITLTVAALLAITVVVKASDIVHDARVKADAVAIASHVKTIIAAQKHYKMQMGSTWNGQIGDPINWQWGQLVANGFMVNPLKPPVTATTDGVTTDYRVELDYGYNICGATAANEDVVYTLDKINDEVCAKYNGLYSQNIGENVWCKTGLRAGCADATDWPTGENTFCAATNATDNMIVGVFKCH